MKNGSGSVEKVKVLLLMFAALFVIVGLLATFYGFNSVVEFFGCLVIAIIFVCFVMLLPMLVGYILDGEIKHGKDDK